MARLNYRLSRDCLTRLPRNWIHARSPETVRNIALMRTSEKFVYGYCQLLQRGGSATQPPFIRPREKGDCAFRLATLKSTNRFVSAEQLRYNFSEWLT